jgi:hypothetical protein
LQIIPAASLPASGEVTHTYNAAADVTISVDLVDEDGTFEAVDTLAVSVAVPAAGVSVDPGGDATQDEGSTFTRQVTFTDGEDAGGDGWTYAIDWDNDGTAEDTGPIAAGDSGFEISRLLADGPDSQTVSVTVTDDAGDSDTQTFNLTTDNVAPTVALAGADSVDEGSTYSLTVGAITDPGDDTVTQYTVNWGDGSSDTISAADLATAGGVLTHTYADGDSTPTITVDLEDEDGTHLGAGSKAITVNNVAPDLTLSGTSSINTGEVYTLTLGSVVDSVANNPGCQPAGQR